MDWQDLRQATLYPQRALSTVALAFGALVLTLAVVGLYGVLGYVVSSRGREFAVRLAVGADPRELVWRVVGQGLRWCLAGVAAGVVIALALGRLLQGFLVDVDPADATSFGVATAVLAASALAAAWIPARRIARLDPVRTLRDS
jgi:ABC-type lipoprotein release transport system permease subunit